jgi:hypothetical protein
MIYNYEILLFDGRGDDGKHAYTFKGPHSFERFTGFDTSAWEAELEILEPSLDEPDRIRLKFNVYSKGGRNGG